MAAILLAAKSLAVLGCERQARNNGNAANLVASRADVLVRIHTGNCLQPLKPHVRNFFQGGNIRLRFTQQAQERFWSLVVKTQV